MPIQARVPLLMRMRIQWKGRAAPVPLPLPLALRSGSPVGVPERRRRAGGRHLAAGDGRWAFRRPITRSENFKDLQTGTARPGSSSARSEADDNLRFSISDLRSGRPALNGSHHLCFVNCRLSACRSPRAEPSRAKPAGRNRKRRRHRDEPADDRLWSPARRHTPTSSGRRTLRAGRSGGLAWPAENENENENGDEIEDENEMMERAEWPLRATRR